MPDSHRFDPLGMDWRDFSKQIMTSYKDSHHQDFSWIEDYVQGMLSQVFSDDVKQKNNYGSTPTRPDVIDTHHYMIVRVKIPEWANKRKLKVFMNPNRIRLTGLGEEDEVVPLPFSGRYEGSKAIFKDDILEIRIPKELNEHYQEIDIQYL